MSAGQSRLGFFERKQESLAVGVNWTRRLPWSFDFSGLLCYKSSWFCNSNFQFFPPKISLWIPDVHMGATNQKFQGCLFMYALGRE
jgi:hypothetical protein